MPILVVGATGYIGSNVTRHLRGAGHDVVALARSAASAERLGRAGVAVFRGDLSAPDTIRAAVASADAVIHVAVGVQVGLVSEADVVAVDAMVDTLAGSGKPLILTSGVAVYAGVAATTVDEATPLETAVPTQVPRIRLEERVVRATERGVRAVVLRPAFSYGRGGAGLLLRVQLERARRTGVGAYIGDGSGLFPVVHVDDLARAYLSGLELGQAGSIFNIVGRTHAAREIAAAMSHSVGGHGRIASLSADEARDAWGPLAPVLRGFPPVSAVRATVELRWTPREPSLMYELAHGSLRSG